MPGDKVVRHIDVGRAPMQDADIDRLLRLPGESMKFVITRNEEPGRTFSADIMENLGQWMRGWLASRMYRGIKGQSKGHTKMVVTIKVEVE
jgi:hypothetical protein